MTVDIPQADLQSRARVAGVAPTRIGAAAKKVGSTTTNAATGAASGLASLASRYASTDDAWAETPASVRACLDYTRAGGWMPGDRAPWLEWLGKGYGYGIAVPATVVGFAALWVVQKPTRLFLTVLAMVLLRVAAGWLLP
jgi:hypothetical protein